MTGLPGTEDPPTAAMTEETPWLSIRQGGEATISLWDHAGGGAFRWECAGDAGVVATLTASGGSRRVAAGCPSATWIAPGARAATSEAIWELRLSTQEPAGARIRLACNGVSPFLADGPGVVPSHFPVPEPLLRLAENTPFTMWCDIPCEMPRLTLQTVLPVENLPRAEHPNGTSIEVGWRLAAMAYHVGEFDAEEGLWSLPVAGCRDGDRVTVMEGLPLFLTRPPRRFPYARVLVEVRGPEGPVPARVQAVHPGGLPGGLPSGRVALRDVLPGEQASLWVPPGPVSLVTSGGPHLRTHTDGLDLAGGSLTRLSVRLDPALRPRAGWYCGDHHMHSYFEDGGQPPEAVVRAARAQGLDYLFLTDEPEGLMGAGLTKHNVPGQFLALPGQELMNRDVHLNALNARATMPAGDPEAKPGTPGPTEWLGGMADEMRQGRPVAMMLNHPSHHPAAQAAHPYFRSWWVGDAHPEIALVENFDFPSWYERLNRGRRIAGLWTTDSHDPVFIPPGARRTYVHVPGDGVLDEASLIDGLVSGRCFNTREPGALLYLTVDGAGPGEKAPAGPGESSRLVEVSCASNAPLGRVDLVCRGEVVRTWLAGNATTVTARERMTVSGWVVALAYPAAPPPAPRNGHEGSPLDLEGCIAFTNPVWIEDRPGPDA